MWSNFDNLLAYPLWKLVTSLTYRNSKRGQCEECKYLKQVVFLCQYSAQGSAVFFFLYLCCSSFTDLKICTTDICMETTGRSE